MTSIFYGEKLEILKLPFTNFFPFGSRPFNSQVVFPLEYISYNIETWSTLKMSNHLEITNVCRLYLCIFISAKLIHQYPPIVYLSCNIHQQLYKYWIPTFGRTIRYGSLLTIYNSCYLWTMQITLEMLPKGCSIATPLRATLSILSLTISPTPIYMRYFNKVCYNILYFFTMIWSDYCLRLVYHFQDKKALVGW